MNRFTKEDVKSCANSIFIEYAALMAFIATESPMQGFQNGKLLIQFEPAWFRKKEPFAPSGKWSVNKVDVQSKEWDAFNNAFSIDQESAMESTSIGLPQIMGFHWKRLGYKSVGEMWDDFKTGEVAHIKALCQFIVSDRKLYTAIKNREWHSVATLYNGSGYMALAKKIGREPYNITLANNYSLYSK